MPRTSRFYSFRTGSSKMRDGVDCRCRRINILCLSTAVRGWFRLYIANQREPSTWFEILICHWKVRVAMETRMPGQPRSSTHIALLGWLYVYRKWCRRYDEHDPRASSGVSQILRNSSADVIQGTIMIHYYSSCRCIM